ncbi:hypothetical protein [Croceicoccus sp. BE223]|uniref:hypothetical protein n=1 Tax=Croceicoccus sp. BE223 TaxID=2817716 RepID=UPI00286A1FA7|nr:hypothetical protein [Croceicoccus sp. BE223]
MRIRFRTAAAMAAALASAVSPAWAQDTLPDGSHAEAGSSAVPPGHQHDATTPAPAPAEPHAMHAPSAGRATALLPNVGNGGFTITTTVPEAQAFFSNGVELLFAFGHDEATAAMAEAVRRDPECAMCRWGHALSLGPNLNMEADADKRKGAYAEVLVGKRLARSGGTDKERALIDALALRFQPRGTVAARDRAYAERMAKLAARWPEDDTLQILAADALVVATDWDKPDMARPIALIEPVLARNPDHTGAIHFYIHATEIAGDPVKAEAAADRLKAMKLEASHLVHMPSHTYYWVGRYQDAADVNRKAVMLGEHQAMTLPADSEGGVWRLPYHAHNVIFGLGGALMSGDARTALMLGRPLVEYTQGQDKGNPVRQLLSAAGYFALARFEDPRVVLALPEPKTPYLAAARHYARGEALAFLGDLAGVRAEIAAIPERIAPPTTEPAKGEAKPSEAPEQMLTIVRQVLIGRIAMAEGRHADAAAAFETAANVEETEDFGEFSDPPAFWYPVRRDMALALEGAGDKAGALREARKTLEIRKNDPVAAAIVQRLAG